MAFTSMDDLRAARNAALAASDFLLLDDAPYPKENRQIALTYREELRALPERAIEIGLENVEIPDYSVFFRNPPRATVDEGVAADSADQGDEPVTEPVGSPEPATEL
jgi:hypothetical protein